MKTCASCERRLPHSEFHQNRCRHDGLSTYCKDCEGKRGRAHYRENKGKYLTRVAAYRQTRKDWLKNYGKEWARNHSAQRYASHKKWMRAHPENSKQHLANQRANRRGAPGKVTSEQWDSIKKKFGYRCPSCGLGEPAISLQRDHIIPIRLGGANTVDNLQPLCSRCNSRKHCAVVRFSPHETP